MERSKVTQTKTVGYISDRYRLLHRWVSEMMLNVQSNFLYFYKNIALKFTNYKVMYFLMVNKSRVKYDFELKNSAY
jgi:hypothetical protein